MNINKDFSFWIALILSFVVAVLNFLDHRYFYSLFMFLIFALLIIFFSTNKNN